MKRDPKVQAEYLSRDSSFPDSAFSLESGDEIRISIDGIGMLINKMA